MTQPSRRTVLAVFLVLGASGCSGAATPTSAEAEAFARTYVDLLNRGDVDALRAHLNNSAQPNDARARLDASGGRTWTTDEAKATELTEGSYAVSLVVHTGETSEGWRLHLDTAKGKFVAGPLP